MFPNRGLFLGFKIQGPPEPVDGISLMPLIQGNMTSRPRPIAFEARNQVSLTDNRYKLISQDRGKTFMLFDLADDPSERKDLAGSKPEIVGSMRKTLDAWRASCKRSLSGTDYR